MKFLCTNFWVPFSHSAIFADTNDGWPEWFPPAGQHEETCSKPEIWYIWYGDRRNHQFEHHEQVSRVSLFLLLFLRCKYILISLYKLLNYYFGHARFLLLSFSSNNCFLSATQHTTRTRTTNDCRASTQYDHGTFFSSFLWYKSPLWLHVEIEFVFHSGAISHRERTTPMDPACNHGCKCLS